jgi:hypothetical protein
MRGSSNHKTKFDTLSCTGLLLLHQPYLHIRMALRYAEVEQWHRAGLVTQCLRGCMRSLDHAGNYLESCSAAFTVWCVEYAFAVAAAAAAAAAAATSSANQIVVICGPAVAPPCAYNAPPFIHPTAS